MATQPDNEDRIERPPRRTVLTQENANTEGGWREKWEKLAPMLVPAILSILLVMIYLNQFVIPKLLTKADFETNFNGLVTRIDEAQASVASMQGVVGGINAVNEQVNQLSGQVSSLSQSVSTMQSNLGNYAPAGSIQQASADVASIRGSVDSMQSDVNSAKQTVSALSTSVETLKAQVATIEGKIASGSPSGGSGSSSSSASIPDVDVDVSVIDEGMIQASDNSTIGEIKIVLTNRGSQDVTDVVMRLYIWFDGCEAGTQEVNSSTYGSWSMRTRQVDEVELRGRLSRLTAGESRRIYLDIKSWGQLRDTSGRRYSTYLDTDEGDVEMIDWNYAD